MKRKVSALIVGVGVAAIVGLGAGTAVAYGPALLSPSGLSAAPGIDTAPKPEATYDTNKQGVTFGSAADANSPDNEPDLIAAVATNGKEGYVKKADLDRANGTTAQKSFKTPEDALKWQAAEGQKDHTITVFDLDGTTAIGEFLVVGQGSQKANK